MTYRQYCGDSLSQIGFVTLSTDPSYSEYLGGHGCARNRHCKIWAMTRGEIANRAEPVLAQPVLSLCNHTRFRLLVVKLAA